MKIIWLLNIGLIISIKLEIIGPESSEYRDNTDVYLSSHSNKEIFLAMFSNYTNSDGEKLYESYSDYTRKKGPQFIIDKMNGLISKNVDKWEYDSNLKKFKLSEESNFV
jgi:hypothetical protein